MDLGLTHKVAIVTGGSRGIGKYCALSLAKEGARVAICSRGDEDINKAVAEIGQFGEVISVLGDITDPKSTTRIHETVTKKLGPIDILVNNVGGGKGGEFWDTSESDLQEAFNLNVFSAFRLINLVIPHMQQQKWGRIICIASIWGREYGGRFSYMTGKAALIAMTKHLSKTLAKDGILVNSVAPGSTDFPDGSWDRFQKQSPPNVVQDFINNQLPMGKFSWPEPIGDLVAFLASKNAGTITGTCINIDAGQSNSLF
jgi:3-oxoacyl-[acyl-carrier protein] reductase